MKDELVHASTHEEELSGSNWERIESKECRSQLEGCLSEGSNWERIEGAYERAFLKIQAKAAQQLGKN